MKILKHVLLILCTFALAASAQAAGQIEGGKIQFIFTAEEKDSSKSSAAFIYFDRTIPGVHSCGAKNSNRFAIDVKTPGGRAHLANAILAHTLGKRVWATGRDECSVWGDTESLRYLWFGN